MYCIECGARIETSTRVCGACMFEQPLEEFPDATAPAATTSAQRSVQPVRFIEPSKQQTTRPKIAAAIAAIIALCLSIAIASYLLSRQSISPASTGVKAPASPASPDCIESGQYESAGEDLSWHQLARQGSSAWTCSRSADDPDTLAARAAQGDKTLTAFCERKATERLVELSIEREGAPLGRFYLGQARCEAALLVARAREAATPAQPETQAGDPSTVQSAPPPPPQSLPQAPPATAPKAN